MHTWSVETKTCLPACLHSCTPEFLQLSTAHVWDRTLLVGGRPGLPPQRPAAHLTSVVTISGVSTHGQALSVRQTAPGREALASVLTQTEAAEGQASSCCSVRRLAQGTRTGWLGTTPKLRVPNRSWCGRSTLRALPAPGVGGAALASPASGARLLFKVGARTQPDCLQGPRPRRPPLFLLDDSEAVK